MSAATVPVVALGVLQTALAVIMLMAATGKFLQSDQFRDAIMSTRVPEPVADALASFVPFLETALAIGLMLTSGSALRISLALLVILLAIFTGWMIWVVVLGLRIACGCFGPAGSYIGAWTVLRNTVFLIAAVATFLLSLVVASPLPTFSLPSLITICSGAASVMLLIALRHAAPERVLLGKQRALEDRQPMREGPM